MLPVDAVDGWADHNRRRHSFRELSVLTPPIKIQRNTGLRIPKRKAERIIAAYVSGMSVRGICRAFRTNWSAVAALIRNRPEMVEKARTEAQETWATLAALGTAEHENAISCYRCGDSYRQGGTIRGHRRASARGSRGTGKRGVAALPPRLGSNRPAVLGVCRYARQALNLGRPGEWVLPAEGIAQKHVVMVLSWFWGSDADPHKHTLNAREPA